MRRSLVLPAALIILSGGAFAAPAGAVSRARHAHHVKKGHTFSFYATVVKASRSGLLVRTRSGKTVHFSATQITRKHNRPKARKHHSRRGQHSLRKHLLLGRAAVDPQLPTGPVAINILGLQPGITVLVTETVSPDGSVTVTITLPPSNVTAQQNATGVLTDLGDSSFEMTTSAGAGLHLYMASQQLSNLNLQTCDTVSVAYHQDAGLLIADDVQVTGTSTSGDCTPTSDASGAIAQVSGSGITINADSGPMSFAVSDPSLTSGFQPGDVVDVTYVQNSDGSMSATDVEYVEREASGTVTAVTSTSLTLTDSSTGQPETFVADPNQGLELCTYAFTGIKVGDQVDLTYHQSATGMVADSVSDPGSGN